MKKFGNPEKDLKIFERQLKIKKFLFRVIMFVFAAVWVKLFMYIVLSM